MSFNRFKSLLIWIKRSQYNLNIFQNFLQQTGLKCIGNLKQSFYLKQIPFWKVDISNIQNQALLLMFQSDSEDLTSDYLSDGDSIQSSN